MAPRSQFKRIDVATARELLDEGEVEIIDVRDAASFSQAHIERARNVSDRNVGDLLTSLPKDRPILIYCYRGNGSQVFAQIFVDFGFTDVYSMDGGFEAWRAVMSDA